MVRLNITVEGQTEEAFIRNTLAPYLGERHVFIFARSVATSRASRGGLVSYPRARQDIVRWMRQESDARFTTMFDLYGLPDDWPGRELAAAQPDPLGRVRVMEDAFREDIGDRRFIPHIQLHEFEALLFVDTSKFAARHPDTEAIAELEAIIDEASNPELINDGRDTHPSARIHSCIPRYSKTVDGPLIAAEIGIERMRERCPHFDGWVAKLIALAE